VKDGRPPAIEIGDREMWGGVVTRNTPGRRDPTGLRGFSGLDSALEWRMVLFGI
jgi:hypothetical protein